MRIRHRARRGPILRLPLLRSCRAFRQLPVILEQVFQVLDVPPCRMRRPCTFKAARDCIYADAIAKAILPAAPLLLNRRTLGLTADILLRIARATTGPICLAIRQLKATTL